MAFYEAFWTVTGAAAPVIALAAVVSAAEVARESDRMLRSYVEFQAGRVLGELQPNKQELDRIRSLFVAVEKTDREAENSLGALIQAERALQANVGLQAALLGFSLISIAYHANFVPPLVAVVSAVLGVMVLGVAGQFTITARRVREHMVPLTKSLRKLGSERESVARSDEGGLRSHERARPVPDEVVD